ncbi:hypothetical protein ACTID9_19005 [Brevibacillus fluminis]|uniref:hypothetical protein n=1 Tax=Brevibacillus fluminis TaxID=511487 RepID=UPI003F8C9265
MLRKSRSIFLMLLVVLAIITGCNSKAEPAKGEQGQLAASFDPENAKEYGIRGIYVGQGIKEAMDTLKPTKYDFMDVESRASLTVDQLANGEGTLVTGMLVVDNSQLMLKVRKGVVDSILVGGIVETQRDKFKTNRGLALYDTVEQAKKLYGDAQGDSELTYKGKNQQMQFSTVNGKIVGFRFELIQQ